MSRTNICLQSEDLRTSWSFLNTRNNADTANVAVAPDGTTTADRVIDDSGGGSNVVTMYQGITVSTSTVYTASFFLKAEQLDWGLIEFSGNGALLINGFFNFTNGATGAKAADTTSTAIESRGDGWYKCSVVFTSDAADTTGNIAITCAEANGDASVARDGTSSILAWGAQLETGLFPTRYIKTEAAAVTKVGADFVRRLDRPLARHISTVW